MTESKASTAAPFALDGIEQDRKDIRRGSTLNILGFLARLCARIPFLLIAGRLYGTASYGEYVLLTAIVETTALLSFFGLKRTIFRFIDSHSEETPKVIRHAFLIATGLSVLLMAIIQMTAPVVLAFFSAPEAASNLIVLAWAIPFISLTDVFLSATLSRRIMRYEVAVRSFVEPITLTVMSLVFFLFGLAHAGLIYAFLCAFGLAALVSAVQCYRLFGGAVFFGGLQRTLFTEILKNSSYTCLHDLSRVMVARLDTFAVGYFFSTSAVGLYGMAQQFLTIVEKVALSFYPMLMPVVSVAVSNGDRSRLMGQLRSAGVRLVLLQLPVVAVFFFFGEDLLRLIGPGFEDAWPVLMILSVGCWINAVMQLVEVPLTYMRPHMNLFGCLGAIAVYLLIVSDMQMMWGVNGIAMTSVLSAFLANIVLITVFTRSRVIPLLKAE